MGKKYIVEIGRLERLYKAFINVGKPELTWLSPEVDLTPYTEPDLEQIRKEAYDKGYHDGHSACYETAKDLMEKKKNEAYKRGLADAWEAARKIAHCFLWGSYQKETGRSSACAQDVLEHYSASEAIEKIRQYEQEQEYCVGDEFENGAGQKFVVTKMDGKEIDRYIDGDGKTYVMKEKYRVMRKTGRHFPEIAAVLEKMRGEQDVPETY